MNPIPSLRFMRLATIGTLLSIASCIVAAAETSGVVESVSSSGYTTAATANNTIPSTSNPAERTANPTPAEGERAAEEQAKPNYQATRAWRLVVSGLLGGAALIAVLWAWLWRDTQPKSPLSMEEASERINAAASGIPTPSDMGSWPSAKLRAIVAGLAEFDDYTVQLRPLGRDVDMELRKRGDSKPRILVKCWPGSAGIASVKHLRNLYEQRMAEGVETGWFVAPRGFSAETRDFAVTHQIDLVGSEKLQNLMRDVPPISLPALLAKRG